MWLITSSKCLRLLQHSLIAMLCGLAIAAIILVDQFAFVGQTPLLVASMGATAVIIFATPDSPLAKPWAVLAGQVLSTVLGGLAAHWIADLTVAASLVVSLSVLLMLCLHCMHPPGAATALVPVLNGWTLPQTCLNLLLPVLLNVLILLLLAGLIRLLKN